MDISESTIEQAKYEIYSIPFEDLKKIVQESDYFIDCFNWDESEDEFRNDCQKMIHEDYIYVLPFIYQLLKHSGKEHECIFDYEVMEDGEFGLEEGESIKILFEFEDWELSLYKLNKNGSKEKITLDI